MRLIPGVTLCLLSAALPAAFAAPAACTAATMKDTLKGPIMTSYQIRTKDRKVMDQVIKGKTTVSTTTMKAIPNGVQMTVTENGKSNVLQTTCVNGKTVVNINGKPMPTDLSTAGQDVQATTQNMKDFASTDFSKRKVGEVWSGQLASATTGDVSSETTFQNKLVAIEKVTTPAGTFDTYKVQMKMDVKITYKNLPKDMKMPNMNSSTVTTTWYARDRPGMIVKSETDGMSMTLLKYKF